MTANLSDFFRLFSQTFNPPTPYRGVSGTNWLISRVWSDYMRTWLREHFSTRLEYPVRNRRLDAALRFGTGAGDQSRTLAMDFALEWEWDDKRVYREFAFGDFKKLLEVPAQCGIAIVQTRIDGRRGPTRMAAESLARIRESVASRSDDRPVGVIEIRRIACGRGQVEFACHFIDLRGGPEFTPVFWRFHA